MAQAEQKTSQKSSHEKVKAASLAFAAYLEATALPVHYIQVRLPDYPIRRVDHETGLSPFRETQVKSTFMWSEAQRRWTRKDGGILVAETEIWHVIQYFIKATAQHSVSDLFNAIDMKVEGIYHGDVDKAWRLWQDSGLSRLEFSGNVRWVGQEPLKLPGLYGRPPSTARINFSSAISSSSAHYKSRDEQPSVRSSNVDMAATPYFHPSRPSLFHVGRSREKGNDVWATFVGSKKRQLRYLDHTLEVVSVKDLDIIWHPNLELNVFQGRHTQEKERTRRQHIIKLIEDNMEDISDSGDDTSRQSTPARVSPRPRPSTRKRRRTIMGATIDESKSDGLSDSDSFPSPSKLLDLYEGRRLRVSSVQTKRAPAYDGQLGKSRRTSGHTINHATGASMKHHATYNHTINHATNARMNDHAIDDLTVNHAGGAYMNDHATHDHTAHHTTNARMINHTTSSPMDRIEGETVSYERMIRTILRVSTSKKPAKAPINILLGNCKDVKEFYSKILSQCTFPADEVRELSATFTWNGRGNLIRKGNHDDWSFFYEDLQRSWKRNVNTFTDSTCEIEIMLHVED